MLHRGLNANGKRRTPSVFIESNPELCEAEARSPAGLRSILRRREAITLYQLRHTFAQNGAEHMTIQDLGRLMGHADLKTMAIYFEVSDRRPRELAGQMASILPSRRAPRLLKPRQPKRKAGFGRKNGKAVS